MWGMPEDLLNQMRDALPIIGSLIVIEGLLSADNILAIAALASELPEEQRKPAVRLGLLGAYVWRGIALLGAALIVRYWWVKLIGALYLIHLMLRHFGESAREGELDAGKRPPRPGFWATVFSIQILDLSLGVDNVVTAVVMSPKFWVICTGVGLGLLTLWLFATLSLKLVARYPVLKHAAFLLVGYVGVILIVEMASHVDLGAPAKAIGIVLILTLSLLYSKAPLLQTALGPVLRMLRPVVEAYDAVFEKTLGLFKKRPDTLSS